MSNIRETILTNLETALAAISTTGGYLSDVEGVDRNIKHPDDYGTGRSKARLVLEDSGDDTPLTAYTGVKRTESMVVNVRAYVSGARQSGPHTAIGKIIADVHKLIDSPVSLGSNAQFARVLTKSRTLHGDTAATVVIPIEIVYWFPVSAP